MLPKGGIDTGEDHGKVLVITHALYGLKSSGASWRAMLADTLTGAPFNFEITVADPDVCTAVPSAPMAPNTTNYYLSTSTTSS